MIAARSWKVQTMCPLACPCFYVERIMALLGKASALQKSFLCSYLLRMKSTSFAQWCSPPVASAQDGMGIRRSGFRPTEVLAELRRWSGVSRILQTTVTETVPARRLSSMWVSVWFYRSWLVPQTVKFCSPKGRDPLLKTTLTVAFSFLA